MEGEYASINSAVDELIPARIRGRIDLIINATFWLRAAIGAVGTIILLNGSRIHLTAIQPTSGWRYAFGIGAVLGTGVLILRRYVPESPRWLMIHGRADEAEKIVGDIEKTVQSKTHPPVSSGVEQDLGDTGKPIGIRVREKTPLS